MLGDHGLIEIEPPMKQNPHFHFSQSRTSPIQLNFLALFSIGSDSFQSSSLYSRTSWVQIVPFICAFSKFDLCCEAFSNANSKNGAGIFRELFQHYSRAVHSIISLIPFFFAFLFRSRLTNFKFRFPLKYCIAA